MTVGLASRTCSKKRRRVADYAKGKGQGGPGERERERGAHLVGLVENREWPFVLWLRRVLKVLDIGADNLAIGDEESLCA